MKITRKNYFELIEHFNFNALPEELKRAHIVLMTRTVKGEKWQAVDDDPELQDLSRIAFAKLEEWILSRTGKPTPEQTIRKRLHTEARKAALDLIRPYVQKGYAAKEIVAEMPAYRHWLYTIYLDGEQLIVQQEHMGKQYMDEFELADIIRSAGGKNDLKGTPRKPMPSSVQQNVWQAALDIIHYLTVDLDKEVADLKQTKRPIRSKGISAELDGEGYLIIKTCEGDMINQHFELDALFKKLIKVIQDKKYTTHYHIIEKDKSAPKLNSREYYFIQSFLNMNGKFLRKETLETFINKLQKAIKKKELRKTSPAAEAIMEIQQVAVDFFNSMNASELLELTRDTVKTLEAMIPDFELRTTHSPAPKGKFKKAKNIALNGLDGTKQDSYASIGLEAMLIERFMGLHDKVITRTTMEKFIEDLQQAIQEKKIRRTSPVAGEIMEMQKAAILMYNRMDRSLHVVLKPATMKRLKGIIVKFDNAVDRAERPKREKPKIKAIPLAGIPGAAPVGRLMNSTDFVKLNFERIGFTGKWLALMGDPAPGFTAMVFGKPKFGKSFLCIEWAGYLARNHGKVLYAAKEEGLDATLQEKLKEKDVEHPNLTVSDYIPQDLSAYDFIFLDSVNKFGLSPQDLEKLKKTNPGKSFIYIFQSTKEGKFRGANTYQHDVDMVIEVPEKGKAVQFGRFNQGGEMNIFDKEPQTQKESALDGIRKSRAQLKNSTRVAHYHRYYYVIDLDERGSFRAHVEDQTGKSLYEFVAGNELGEDESDLFQDGWMKGKNDIRGLEKYLRQQGVIGRYDQIMAELEAGLGAAKSGDKENLLIRTELSIALKDLGDMIQLNGEDQSAVISAIKNEEPRVGENVRKITQSILTRKQPNVKLQDISFKEIDSTDWDQGFAYFTITLEGEEGNLKKIAGVETDKKIFFYDWENHH